MNRQNIAHNWGMMIKDRKLIGFGGQSIHQTRLHAYQQHTEYHGIEISQTGSLRSINSGDMLKKWQHLGTITGQHPGCIGAVPFPSIHEAERTVYLY